MIDIQGSNPKEQPRPAKRQRDSQSPAVAYHATKQASTGDVVIDAGGLCGKALAAGGFTAINCCVFAVVPAVEGAGTNVTFGLCFEIELPCELPVSSLGTATLA